MADDENLSEGVEKIIFFKRRLLWSLIALAVFWGLIYVDAVRGGNPFKPVKKEACNVP